MRHFALLDRDGTIIVEKHYLSDPDGVELIPGAAEGLGRLASLGLGLIVVTNQSAVARGIVDLEQLGRIHARMDAELAAHGVRLDDLYFCPHLPDAGCACRKPRPGLVERAARRWGFDPAACFVVGDAAGDVDLARGLGATSLLVRTGYGRETEAQGQARPDHVVDDLGAAAARIQALLAARPSVPG